MSAETWKEEFYPIDADEAARNYRHDDIKLVKHDLQKWKGFLPKNLKLHEIEDGDDLPCSNDCDSCVLCEVYYPDDNGRDCIRCPLFKLRNERCFEHTAKSPKVYTSKTDENNFPCDPEVMIQALEDTLIMLKGSTDENNSEDPGIPTGVSNEEDRSSEQESCETRTIPHLGEVYPD